MEAIIKSWSSEPQISRSGSKLKVPIPGQKNYLITSALPYVNNVPHLGNIIGCVLSGDVFSRYCTIKGYNALYVCGTDEYGTTTEVKALQEGVSPNEICTKFHAVHKDIYEWFNIDFAFFGRTTTDSQTEITHDIFKKLYANGMIEEQEVDQLHCENCNRFLADRYVNGICPIAECKYDDARGDQCDGCGKLINAIELVDPKCSLCKKTPSIKKSKHLFLCLDKLSDQIHENLKNTLKKADHHWSPNAVAIAKSWFKVGLEKRCITRDLKWGTSIPIPGYEDKVFYVWFDAAVGYLSITKELLGEDWKKWWKNPDEVELYHFLGKDNVVFHSVMFPGTLIGTKDNYTIVNHICATEYLNYEDKKFSKSRGTGVFGDAAKESGIPADVWRFYLLYMRPESSDTYFSWDDFLAKVNNELSNNLGNLCNRALKFLKSNYDGVVPKIELNEEDKGLLVDISQDLVEFDQLLTDVKLRDALMKILAISRRGNQYWQNNKPWVALKTRSEGETPATEAELKRAASVTGFAVNLVYLISTVLHPFMPQVSKEIRKQCNFEDIILLPTTMVNVLKEGHVIGEPVALFTKLEAPQIAEFKKKFGSSDPVEAAKTEVKKAKTVVKDKKVVKEVKKVVPSHYPKAQSNIAHLEKVIAGLEMFVESAGQAYAQKKISQINQSNVVLQQEVDELLVQLNKQEAEAGIKQIAAPKKRVILDTALPSVPEKVEVASKKEKVVKEKAVKINNNKAPAVEDTIDIGRLDLRVGRIIKAERHPDAEALYLETIDLGEDKPRTVISGLVKHIPLDQMQDRLVVCLCNLKPAKMRGIESQAMVMCASTPDKVEIMEVDPSCKPGQKLLCGSYVNRPDAVLNPKKKIWETCAPDLKVNTDGKATYKGQVVTIEGGTFMTAPTLKDVYIK